MKKIIITAIVVGLLTAFMNSAAQTEETKEKPKTDLTFKLKEPVIEKKSALDVIKTVGIAGGGLAVGVAAVVLASPKKTEEKPATSTDLPSPPNFPNQKMSVWKVAPLLWFVGK